jgi:hypothetical protein
MKESGAVIEGLWEDVSAKHSGELQGHLVEIRVMDEKEPAAPKESLRAFEARIRQLTGGIRLPEGKVYTAEDIYECSE